MRKSILQFDSFFSEPKGLIGPPITKRRPGVHSRQFRIIVPIRPSQEYEFQNWFLYLKFLNSALQSGNEILSDLNNKSDVIPEKSNSVLPGGNQGAKRVSGECQVRTFRTFGTTPDSGFPRNDVWVTIL